MQSFIAALVWLEHIALQRLKKQFCADAQATWNQLLQLSILCTHCPGMSIKARGALGALLSVIMVGAAARLLDKAEALST